MDSLQKPDVQQKQVPARFAKSILRAAEAQGYVAQDILASAELDFNPLDSDENATLDAALYNRLYRRIMDLLQDECFGLHLNRKVPAGTFRMTCLCIIHCTSLRHAIERASEFNAFCRALIGVRRSNNLPLTVTDDVATMVFEQNSWLFGRPGEENIPALIYSMSSWRRLCSWLIGRNIETIEVLLATDEPRQAEKLYEVFQCPISFNQPINGFRFAAYHLDSPIIQTEDSLKEFLRR